MIDFHPIVIYIFSRDSSPNCIWFIYILCKDCICAHNGIICNLNTYHYLCASTKEYIPSPIYIFRNIHSCLNDTIIPKMSASINHYGSMVLDIKALTK